MKTVIPLNISFLWLLFYYCLPTCPTPCSLHSLFFLLFWFSPKSGTPPLHSGLSLSSCFLDKFFEHLCTAKHREPWDSQEPRKCAGSWKTTKAGNILSCHTVFFLYVLVSLWKVLQWRQIKDLWPSWASSFPTSVWSLEVMNSLFVAEDILAKSSFLSSVSSV